MIDTTQGMAQPERARFLKERFLSRRPSICLEGALAKTRAFRKTEAAYKPWNCWPYHRLGKNKYALLGRAYALESLGPMSKEDLARRAAFVAERLGGTKVLF